MAQNALSKSELSCLRPFFDITTVQFRNNHSQKEAWCLACISARAAAILEDDQRAVTAGHRVAIRSRVDAELVGACVYACNLDGPDSVMFAARGTTPGQPLCSSLDTLNTHVKACGVCVPADRREEILEQRRIERQGNAVKRARPILGAITNSLAAHIVAPSGQSAFVHASPTAPYVSFAPQGVDGAPLLPSSSALPTFATVPLQRTDTLPQLPLPPNAADSQRAFAEDLCRVFVACNIAWNAAANPELKAFFAKWLPHVRVPDRRTLSGPTLRAEKQKAVDRVKSKVRNKFAMLQCDGWKNVARMPLITFMMTVDHQVRSFVVHRCAAETRKSYRATSFARITCLDSQRRE